jgi:hypothetical protein
MTDIFDVINFAIEKNRSSELRTEEGVKKLRGDLLAQSSIPAELQRLTGRGPRGLHR